MKNSTDPYRSTMNRLNRISASLHTDIDRYCADLLSLGREIFDCESGFISQVKEGYYHPLHVSGKTGGVTRGVPIPLHDTLCAVLFSAETVVAIQDMAGDDSKCHPALPPESFGRYIGVPIIIDEEIYGTMSFSSGTRREQPYSVDDIELMSLMSLGLATGIKLHLTNTELQKTRNTMRLIMDNIPAQIIFKDAHNRILQANRTAANAMGFDDPDRLEGADSYKLFPKQAAKYHADDLAVINSGNALRRIIERYTPINADEGWVSTDKIPLELDNGEKAILMVALDITDQVTAGLIEETNGQASTDAAVAKALSA